MNIQQLRPLAWVCLAAPNALWAATPIEDLGRQLFFDTNLSSPAGQACASCHSPAAAFTDPDKSLPTSRGVISGRFGNRNSPTAMYSKFSPTFGFDAVLDAYVGGQFYDGRAADLVAQAQGPFLNHLEMANPDKDTVVNQVSSSSYASLFTQVFGANAFADTNQAYLNIAIAIAAFENTSVFAPFNSKFDAFRAGRATLTAAEQRGWNLYTNANKGNCEACHTSLTVTPSDKPLLTDFTYDNLGVPRNPNNPFYILPSSFNPDGFGFVDYGLGQTVANTSEDGKMKVPTLRNIAKTGPYMHNGYFATLKGVVHFYNTRDIKQACLNALTTESQALSQNCWPEPEVTNNVNHDELGNLGLTNSEENDIVAFMRTLTDGYGDVDQDGDVDNSDLALIVAAKNQNASNADDARDLNADGKIDLLDSRKLALLCTRPLCATH